MYLLFDIGGTKMRLATSVDARSLGPIKIAPTPETPAAIVAEFKKLADELLDGARPQAVVGGATRRYEPVKAEIGRLFDAPCFTENDAALCCLGEAVMGAGRGAAILLYVTVSTGVGGARIVDGKIDRKTIGFEPGRQIINCQGEVKTLESFISGRSLEARFGQAPKEMADQALWDESARYLAYGLHNMIMHWSPELVVLGGSMITGRPGIEIGAVERELHKISHIFPSLPAFKQAELGDLGGLHGALEYLRQNLPA
jgi:predicted NBD/HSP70 family sugar kinase